MAVDDFALLRRQGAAWNAQVVHLVLAEQRLFLAPGVGPAARGNVFHPLLVDFGHGFSTAVNALQKRQFFFQGANGRFHALPMSRFIFRFQQAVFFIAKLNFCPQGGKTAGHFVNSIVQGM